MSLTVGLGFSFVLYFGLLYIRVFVVVFWDMVG